MICLRRIEVSSDLFEKILFEQDPFIKEINKEQFQKYECGYKAKGIIYRCQNELIIRTSLFKVITNRQVFENEEQWKQVIVTCRGELEINTVVSNSTTGPQAKKYMNSVLSKYYTDEEIDACLMSHQEEEDYSLKQRHEFITRQGKIMKYEDTYYYDINNAHGSNLAVIFPKAIKEINKMYEHRKDRDGFYKKIFNYYVGMIGKKTSKYRKTYNWIVHNVTRKINDLQDKLDGVPIYVNTDGIMLYHVKNVLNGSDKLGEFKREHGTLYTYSADNYEILQFVNDEGIITTKGNLPISLRSKIDLIHGKVVSYKRIKVSNHYEYKDVKEIDLNGTC